MYGVVNDYTTLYLFIIRYHTKCAWFLDTTTDQFSGWGQVDKIIIGISRLNQHTTAANLYPSSLAPHPPTHLPTYLPTVPSVTTFQSLFSFCSLAGFDTCFSLLEDFYSGDYFWKYIFPLGLYTSLFNALQFVYSELVLVITIWRSLINTLYLDFIIPETSRVGKITLPFF